MNIKVIILIIGVLLFTFGFINGSKPDLEKKQIYKILPQNVYDNVLISSPMKDFDDDNYNNIYPSYILDNNNNYNSLFKKSIDTCISDECKNFPFLDITIPHSN